jgi:hypothetical protein
MSADINECGCSTLASVNAPATVSTNSIPNFAEESGACDHEIERIASPTYSQGSQSLNNALSTLVGKYRAGSAAAIKYISAAIVEEKIASSSAVNDIKQSNQLTVRIKATFGVGAASTDTSKAS